MKELTVKYEGACHKCGQTLKIGQQAIYEKRVGIFCPACAPTGNEEIRKLRQEAADKKADKYEEWAAKRRKKAEATLDFNYKHYTSDIAFNTQPGHMPIRARVIKQNDKAYESLEIAKDFERKAKSLRHVVVAGDAEAERQAQRDAIRPTLQKGMQAFTALYGKGIIEKINRKTVLMTTESGYKVSVDLSWIK